MLYINVLIVLIVLMRNKGWIMSGLEIDLVMSSKLKSIMLVGLPRGLPISV